MKFFDFGVFQNKMQIDHHMTKSSSTCFLGHFILLPVFSLKIAQKFEYHVFNQKQAIFKIVLEKSCIHTAWYMPHDADHNIS